MHLQAPKKSICLATVKSEITREESLKGTVDRVVGLFEDIRLGVRNLGVFSSSVSLRESISRAGCEGLILLVGTGGTESIIYGVLRDLNIHTLLVAYEGLNSLPAMLEAHAALVSEGRKWVNSVFLELSKIRESREALVDALKPLFAVLSMRGARIGVIGRPSPWLIYSRAGKADVKELFGAELIDIPIERLAALYERAEAPEREVEGLASVATPRITREHIRMALKLYYAIKELVRDYSLSAVTVECFRVAEMLGVTPCYALARLNSEGVDAGCEGDVPSLLTLMLLRRLSDQPAMMGNVASIREGDLTLAHCTAPLNLATSFLLDTHMETGLGVGVTARLPTGRQVTIAKLDTRKKRIVALTGRIVESGMLSPRLCRTQVVIKTNRRLSRLLEDPVGAHMVLTIGNVLDQLRTASRLIAVDLVEV